MYLLSPGQYAVPRLHPIDREDPCYNLRGIHRHSHSPFAVASLFPPLPRQIRNTSDSGVPARGERGQPLPGNMDGSRSSESGSSRVTSGDRLYDAPNAFEHPPFQFTTGQDRLRCEDPAPSTSNTVSHLSRTDQTHAILPSRMLHRLPVNEIQSTSPWHRTPRQGHASLPWSSLTAYA